MEQSQSPVKADQSAPIDYLPCVVAPDCPYIGNCHETIHHELYPAKNYRTVVEKTFRNLPENKALVCRRLHDLIHKSIQGVDKPSRETMLGAITASEVTLTDSKKRRIYGKKT